MAKWPYNTKIWKRLRMLKLACDPLCHACLLRGETTQADTVDHITAIKAGGKPFPPLDGLMSLCARCHNEKTAAVDRNDRASLGKILSRRFKGFDENGNPIDPGDDWYGGGQKDQKCEARSPAMVKNKYLVSGDIDNTSGFA